MIRWSNFWSMEAWLLVWSGQVKKNCPISDFQDYKGNNLEKLLFAIKYFWSNVDFCDTKVWLCEWLYEIREFRSCMVIDIIRILLAGAMEVYKGDFWSMEAWLLVCSGRFKCTSRKVCPSSDFQDYNDNNLEVAFCHKMLLI